MASRESYSGRLSTGSRTYFFDVKHSESGGIRLEVSESKKVNGGFERNRIVIFNDDTSKFVEEMLKAVSAMGESPADST